MFYPLLQGLSKFWSPLLMAAPSEVLHSLSTSWDKSSHKLQMKAAPLHSVVSPQRKPRGFNTAAWTKPLLYQTGTLGKEAEI